MKKTFQLISILCLLSACEDKSDSGAAAAAKDTTVQSAPPESRKPTQATSPDQFKSEIDSGIREVAFHGMGTEPFWMIYLTEHEFLYWDEPNQIKESGLLEQSFDENLTRQTLVYTLADGTKGGIDIIREPGSDGMSDRVFPYTVKVKNYYGAGDSKLMKDFKEYEKGE